MKPDNIEVLDAPDDSVPKYEVPKAKAQGTMKAEPKAVPKTEDTKAEPIPSKPVYNDETKKEPLRSSANVNTRGNHNNDTTTEKKVVSPSLVSLDAHPSTTDIPIAVPFCRLTGSRP